MKKTQILSTVCLLLALSLPAAAQTDKPSLPASGQDSHSGHSTIKSPVLPEKVQPPASGHESHTGRDAAKPPAPASTSQAPGHDHGIGPAVQMMEGHMKKMRAQMEIIKVTANPLERRKLIQEHLADMQESIKMMKNIPGCRAMAAGMQHGASAKAEMQKTNMDQMMTCHKMMEMKMELMQEMMEGLIESSRIRNRMFENAPPSRVVIPKKDFPKSP